MRRLGGSGPSRRAARSEAPELHLWLELDAGGLVHTAAHFLHQGAELRGRAATAVHEVVRVQPADLDRTFAQRLAASGLDEAPRRVARGIAEHAAHAALRDRLRRVPLLQAR